MEAEVVGAQFRLYRSTAGFVRVDWFDGAEVTGQDAREALLAIGSLTVGRPTPVLADVRSGRSVSREARRAFADSPVASRVALLVGSSLSRVLANFLIGVSHPSIPTRMFTDLDAAQRCSPTSTPRNDGSSMMDDAPRSATARQPMASRSAATGTGVGLVG